MSGSDQTTVRHELRREVRRLVRVTPPAWGWWWRGLVPLVALLVVALFAVTRFAHHWVEDDVRDRSRAALDAAGMEWVKVMVDGQNVVLRGVRPSELAGLRAIQLVEEVRGSTWTGERDCTIDVRGEFTDPVQPTVTAVEPPVAPARWHDVIAELRGSVLSLRGEVHDQATADRLATRARALIAAPRITDVRLELKVSGTPGLPADPLYDRAIDDVARCVAGTGAVTHGVFSLRCDVNAADKPALEAAAHAPTTVGTIGGVELLAIEEVKACDTKLAGLLAASTIQFDTGSAAIKPASDGLLGQIAAIAASCPGRLRIEGHTDSVGDPKANQLLSEARAASVRAALVKKGIEAARLLAFGLGQTKPIADNATLDGRAKNRRIVISVVHAE